MTIGDRIKYRREELHMSQDELAKKLGYKSRSSVNKIELNQRNLTQSKIKMIADALETTPSYIMGWDESTNTAKIQQEVEACELFEQCYGKEAFQAVAMFLKLDSLDRSKVVERMATLLEDEKYSVQEGLLNA